MDMRIEVCAHDVDGWTVCGALSAKTCAWSATSWSSLTARSAIYESANSRISSSRHHMRVYRPLWSMTPEVKPHREAALPPWLHESGSTSNSPKLVRERLVHRLSNNSATTKEAASIYPTTTQDICVRGVINTQDLPRSNGRLGLLEYNPNTITIQRVDHCRAGRAVVSNFG